MYEVRKTFDHSLGISACFRQWRASHSHCQYLHGYALKVVMVFQSGDLDDRKWVVDFGGLKEVKQWIVDTFDHKTLVAHDDPMRDVLMSLADLGVIDITHVEHVGCESFAKMIWDFIMNDLESSEADRIRECLVRVEIHEHGGNMAAYEGDV